MQITFTTAVSQLSLQAIGFDAGDSVTISAYAGSSLLRSLQFATPLDVDTDPNPVLVDFSAFSGVTKLVFDDESSGLAYGQFSFTPSVSPVPEPTTGLMMLLGVAAIGRFVRRRQAG